MAFAAIGCGDGESDGDQDALRSVDCPEGALDAGDADETGESDGAVTPGRDAGADGGVDAGVDAGVDGGTPDASEPSVDAQVEPGPELPVHIAEVTANGTGCPQGTWRVVGSRVEFSSYEALIDAKGTDAVATKDCTLSIVPAKAGPNVSVALTSLTLRGYTFLQPALSANASARAWWQGNPTPSSNSNRVTWAGARDEDFIYKQVIETSQQVWSPCGVARDLNINTRIQVVAAPAGSTPASGYISINNIDLNDIELATRACSAGKGK